MNEINRDLEKMTGPNSLLGTDADGNDHHTAPSGDGGFLAWIVADGAVVYDQTVDSLGAYVNHVADVTGWDEVNYSERGLGEALCDVVEDEADPNAGKELVTDGGQAIDWHRGAGDPVPVADDCPDCGSDETVTSAFAAATADETPRLSSWCEACGFGFMAAALADDVDRGRGVATDGGEDIGEEYDTGKSVVEVDGVETWVDRKHLDSCERAGAEVREE